MKFLFSILITVLIPFFSYAQITIEEKVEIDPQQQIIQPDNPTGTHTIQLDVQWDQPEYDATIVGVNVPCQSAGADWQSGGIISLTINDAMAGFYRLQPRFNTPSGVTTVVTYQLYFDGLVVREGTESLAGGFHNGSFPFFNIEYTPPLVSGFLFSLGNDISCLLTPTPVNISPSNSCSTGSSWNNTDPLTLTITSGSEFASFYDENQQPVGDIFTGTFSESQNINLIQDSVYRDAAVKNVVVQCQWGDLVKEDLVQLQTQNGDVIVASPDDDSLYTGQTASVDLYPNDFGGECTIFFPFEDTYSAQIIEGNQYGNLIEPNTGLPVQSFTGLGHYFGMALFDYVANGVSVDVLDSVIIRVSTSDPKIPHTDLTIYIKPAPIYVYTNPDVVSASDTADVIIKKRNPDGTLEDFPPEQTFELAVLDGCINGNILVGDSVGVYFADVQQPIKFVTADSLESDSGTVRLRVGTDLSGFMRPMVNKKVKEEKQLAERKTGLDTLRAGFEKMMAEKKAERLALQNKTGEEPPIEAPIVEACYAGNYINEIGYWEGDVKYERDGCGKGAPKCTTNVQVPLRFKEEVTEATGNHIFYKEGYYPTTLKSSSGGQTHFLYDGEFKIIPISKPNDPVYGIDLSGSFYSTYEIETCFNNNLNNGKGAYQFSFKSVGETDNFIHKPIIIQVADYSNDSYEMKSINDLATIPFESICKALIDFEYNRYRASVDVDNFFEKYNVLYGIVEAYWEHEKYHKRDAMRFINNNYNKKKLRIPMPDGTSVSKTLKSHLNITLTCSEFIKSYDDAKREGEKYIKNALKGYAKFFKDNWYKKEVPIYFDGDWKWYNETELYTHWSNSVQGKITRYQSVLASRSGFDPTICEEQLKEIRKLWDPFKKYRNSL